MRFFAHDGKAVHGPASIAEVAALPSFDGDMLVCPVGSEDSADWKPALAYPPFREILLAPAPKPAAPPPPAPLPPPPPAPAVPCPRCSARNPDRARYCNECGARMDGTVETPPRPALEPIPLPQPPSPVPLPAAVPAAAVDDGASLRKTLIAAFLGASLASGGLGYYLLRPRHAKVPAGHEIDLTPPAAPAPAPAAAPVAAPVPAPVAPVPEPAPIVPAAKSPEAASKPAPKAEEERPAPRPKRVARKPKRAKPKAAPIPAPEPAPAGDGAGESLIESRVNSMDGAAAEPKPASVAPKTEALAPPSGGEAPTSAAGESPAAAGAAPDGGFMLPGLPRRVGPKSVTKAKADAKAPPPSKPSEAPSPSVPAAAGAAAGAAAASAATPAPDAATPPAEDPTARQVREQFEFCGQLLSQGAFDDHFDTCLCAETRNGAPYRGRRGLYATALKKSAGSGKLETIATISGVALDGANAKVTALWKTSPADRGRTLVERWQLEDGLWCRAP